jgi:type IV pilus assembly protein PilY1
MRNSNLLSLSICALIAVVGGIDKVQADDTEVFFSDASDDDPTKANILMILDTSGSMNRAVGNTAEYVDARYDREHSYPNGTSGCDSTRIYYWPVARGTRPTSCTDPNIRSFPASDMRCNAANNGLNGRAGYYGGSDQFIRLRQVATNTYRWQASLDQTSAARSVECRADRNEHGYDGNSSADYPRANDSNTLTGSWTSNSGNSWWNNTSGSIVYLFNPNYIRYRHNPPQIFATTSRLDTVKDAVEELLGAITTEVNLGVMRYDSGGHGGMVVAPVADLTDANKTAILNTVSAFEPAGATPLSETLFEAYRYLSGGEIEFGDDSTHCTAINNDGYNEDGACTSGATQPLLSVASSRAGGDINATRYASPIAAATCEANNHIIFLTDGLPNGDDEVNSDIDSLVTAASCDDGDGDCLGLLSQFMRDNNVNGTNTTVKTHYIGFGSDLVSADAVTYLTEAATSGGGSFYTANNISSLTDAFNAIVNAAAADTSATFTAPSVAVNSFNKTQILEDLYVAMFKPGVTKHWPGNLKKFKLRDIDPDANVTEMAIVGQGATAGSVSTTSAVNSSNGFFALEARDFWQTTTDVESDITTRGGAANKLPSPVTTTGGRKLYTYIGVNNPLSVVELDDHPVDIGNGNITDARLGTIASPGCGTATNPCKNTVINWARGDLDGDLSTSDTRFEMGDPIHSQPAVVIYANSADAIATNASLVTKVNDAYVYVATNDGYLHAVDVVSGQEKWAFIPQEFLSGLKNLLLDDETVTKHYALDGDIRVLRYDANNNGRIDVGSDRVILYVSQGRGGSRYYALDITEKNNPKFMWSLGSSDLGGIVQQSWSTPSLGRVQVGDGSIQNSQRLVLIFAGGYDALEDSQSYLSGGDDYGNGLFMIDAVTGRLLWSQTEAADGAFLKMTHAIPSNVTTLDTNDDGFTDRMYVGDLAGQIWRFDITSCTAAACATDTTARVAGGVIASLGAKQASTNPLTDNRSFYNAPDIAKMIVRNGPTYYNIGIGSGDRSFPKSNISTQDKFYSLRDYTLAPMTQATYNTLTPILESNLTPVTGNAVTTFEADAKGWMLSLSSREKALAQSITVDGVVMFTTFIPGTSTNSCEPTTGSARAYSVRVNNAFRRFGELYESFNTTGLPPQVSVVNSGRIIGTTGGVDTDGDGDIDDDDNIRNRGAPAVCLSGVTVLGRCVDFGSRVKTIWQESGVN